MQYCNKCFNKNWKHTYIDGWIRSECNICGEEIEFQVKKDEKNDKIDISGAEINLNKDCLASDFEIPEGYKIRVAKNGNSFIIQRGQNKREITGKFSLKSLDLGELGV